jgi:hypothetical protein
MAKKLLAIKRQGVYVFSRRLRYREKEIKIDNKDSPRNCGRRKRHRYQNRFRLCKHFSFK